VLHTGSAASRLLSVRVVWFAMAAALVPGMAGPTHADRAAPGEPPPLLLADFGPGSDLEALHVSTTAASVAPTHGGAALRLCAAEQGEDASLTLAAPEGVWDLSDYDAVVVELRNPGGAAAVVHGIAGNPGAESGLDSCRGVLVLAPHARGRLTIELVSRPVAPGFAPFEPFLRYARNINVRDGTVNPAEIASIRVALEAPHVDQAIEIDAISAVGRGAKGPAPFFPFVDEFGQYIHADWPGKVRSEEDFAVRRAEESAEMADWPGPPDWDEYGGWAAGPTLDATGFFYPAKHEGKWWLVDPEGKLFWSYGPTGVGFGGSTPITDREQWFRGLPERDSAFGQFYGEGRGARDRYYRDKSYQTFDFAHANLYRKYGPDYAQAVSDLSHRRLRSWGFNTIANWSDMDICLQRKTPYVVAIHFGGPWLDGIPDAFDSRFRQTVRERMKQERGGSAGDPWCIGYFVQNELWWGYWDDGQAVALAALRAPPTAAAKRVFVQRLRGKYETVRALNESWGTAYQSWHEMLASREAPDRERAEVARDCGEFGLEFCETYFSTVRDEVKRVAPDNLYLGCRFHGHIDLDLIEIAARYCDVISYNVYDRDPGARLNRYLGVIDKPFIVGEFGVGSDPRQTPFRGDQLSVDPDERPRALTSYLEKAFRHPLMVGAHFFQYRDQPITGRPDGEAVLRGFINTADTPHLDLVQANRRTAYHLYTKRTASN
jgi:hypothetical protein